VTLLNKRKDGTPFWNEVFLSPVFDDEGQLVEYIGVQNDVTDTRVAQDQAEYLAFHDSLTGLANRALLSRVLHRSVDRARHQDRQVALVFLDLDRFKEVNDAHGHAAGDELLRAVAQRLQSVVRPGDLLARQGGDEFALVMGDLESRTAASDALAVAEKVRGALAEPVEVAGQPVAIRCSVGVSLLGRDAADADLLLRHADIAMYRAKRAGGAGVRLYRDTGGGASAPAPALPEPLDAGDALDRAARARRAARRRGPHGAVPADRRPRLRRRRRRRGAGPRAEGLAARVPRQALRHRPRDRPPGRARLGLPRRRRPGGRRRWPGRGRRLFLNVEPEALAMPCPEHLVDDWGSVADKLDIVVEITERALTARPGRPAARRRRARARGWGIALDDVGADVRSLALMPLLRPDVIKLDLRLVHEQATTEVAEIVNAVNAERERTGASSSPRASRPRSTSRPPAPSARPSGQGWLFGRPGRSSRRARRRAGRCSSPRRRPRPTTSRPTRPSAATARCGAPTRPAHRAVAAARAPGRRRWGRPRSSPAPSRATSASPR
jgi:diguanylate cyclase (GGDEF)-like protein